MNTNTMESEWWVYAPKNAELLIFAIFHTMIATDFYLLSVDMIKLVGFPS